MRKLLFVALAAISLTAVIGYVLGRRRYETWGIEEGERELALAGDDLIAEPTMSDTRATTIEALPSAVWPWLVQLGYGRGGWYSYGPMNMKGTSADAILPEFQALAVGDIVPTDANGGLEVKVVDPEHALVLYVDQALVAKRMAASGEVPEALARGAGRGRFMQNMQGRTPPEFALTLAFVLQPIDGNRTRLIERVRARFVAPERGSRAMAPMLGFGAFVMTRRQLLGIKERAERPAQAGAIPPPEPQTPAADAGNGHAPDLAEAAPAS